MFPRGVCHPAIDERKGNRRVIKRIDTDVELVPVCTVIARVRVTMQQWQTMIVWAMCAVALDGLRVTLVRIVRCEQGAPAS